MAKVPTFSEQQIDYFMQEALNEAKLAGDEGKCQLGQ